MKGFKMLKKLLSISLLLPAVFILSACNEKKEAVQEEAPKEAETSQMQESSTATEPAAQEETTETTTEETATEPEATEEETTTEGEATETSEQPASSETTMDNNATQDLVTQAIEAVDNPEQMQQLIEQNAETIKNMADTLTEGGTEAMQEALTNALQNSN